MRLLVAVLADVSQQVHECAEVREHLPGIEFI